MTHITNSDVAEGSGCNSPADYEVKLRIPADLTKEEVAMCIAIIRGGEAVSLKAVQRELPNAAILVVARCNNQIVAVGAIKRLRAEYAAGIARKSGAEFPAETPELGYVAIDPAHQRRGLSHRLVQLLLSGRKDRLFATTSAAAMKKVLALVLRKKEMSGRANILNYLVGSGNNARPDECNYYKHKGRYVVVVGYDLCYVGNRI